MYEVELIAAGFGALEGPVIDDTGALCFSDLKAGGVHRLLGDGGREVLIPQRPAVGGLCLHRSGGLVASGADLVHISPAGNRVLLTLDDLDPRTDRAVGFNDLHADRQGRIFVGVLRHDASGRPAPGEVIWVTAPRRHTVVHDDIHPNGIALSPDGTRLYAADTFRRRLVILRVAPDGAAEPVSTVSTEAVAGLPDGIACDEAGGVWVAFYRGGCVARFTAAGALDRVIELPVHKPLSLCFSGPDARDLYIVTGTDEDRPGETGRVLRIALDVAGALVAPAAI